MSQIDIIEKLVNYSKNQNEENKKALEKAINKEKIIYEIIALLFLIFVAYFSIFGFGF